MSRASRALSHSETLLLNMYECSRSPGKLRRIARKLRLLSDSISDAPGMDLALASIVERRAGQAERMLAWLTTSHPSPPFDTRRKASQKLDPP